MCIKLVLYSIILYSITLLGCVGTDVPISRNTDLPDERLLGYWQESPDECFYVHELENGKVLLSTFRTDSTSGRFELIGKYATFYTSIKDDRGKFYFCSVGKNGNFQTFKIKFDESDNLIIRKISSSYLEKYSKSVNDVVSFGSPENFYSWTKQNMRNENFFNEPQYINKIKSPQYLKRSQYFIDIQNRKTDDQNAALVGGLLYLIFGGDGSTSDNSDQSPKSKMCPTCSGTGNVRYPDNVGYGWHSVRCYNCNGSGSIQDYQR